MRNHLEPLNRWSRAAKCSGAIAACVLVIREAAAERPRRFDGLCSLRADPRHPLEKEGFSARG